MDMVSLSLKKEPYQYNCLFTVFSCLKTSAAISSKKNVCSNAVKRKVFCALFRIQMLNDSMQFHGDQGVFTSFMLKLHHRTESFIFSRYVKNTNLLAVSLGTALCLTVNIISRQPKGKNKRKMHTCEFLCNSSSKCCRFSLSSCNDFSRFSASCCCSSISDWLCCSASWSI